MADRASRRARRLAAAAAREAALARAAVRAYNRLLKATEELLRTHDYNPDVLDDRIPAWRDAVDEELVPEVSATYIAGLIEDARDGVTLDAQAHALRYLTSRHNLLVGVADYAFDVIRAELSEGIAGGDTIPELAARVESVLTDEQRWANRGTVVARTEVVAAMNAGHEDAARLSAEQLGVDLTVIAKEWLATNDTRTRPHHREADGEVVMGLATKFHVGESFMLRPGDPEGGPDEVIQCRCTVLYHFPDDLEYPSVTAGGTMDPATHDRLARLFDVSRMPPKLQTYWLTGPGAAKIGYGAPGAFKRCQTSLRGKVPGRMIDGTCANLIHKATGEWPGDHGKHAAGITTWDAALSRITGRFAADGDSPMVEPPPGAYPDDYVPSDPEDDEPDTGLWIGVLPAADEDVHGIGPEEKHATMFFLGEADQFTDTDHTDLVTLLQAWAATCPPITSNVIGMDRLGRDPEHAALVWLLDDELAGPREALASTPLLTRLLEVAADLQFPDYLPHSTVGYPDSQTDDVADDAWPAIEDAAADVASIRFDRIAMWWGSDRSAEWPLTGSADTPMPDQPKQQEDDAAMSAAATEVEAQTDVDLTWVGILCPEGIATGDRRKFGEGSIEWMATPGVLKAMFADKPGHDDSVPVGLIRGIERMSTGQLAFHGTWSTGEEAEKARQWNIDGRLRGVSVDLDDVEYHLEDASGNVVEGDALWELTEEPTLVVDRGRVRAATLWCTPAYVEAYVLDSTVADDVPDTSIVDASGTTPLGLAAAAAFKDTELIPADAAPSSAFANPGLTEPTCLTVTEDGRVFGHLATWGTCHIGIEGACVTPPSSEADYAYFATGMYECSDGEVLPVGQLTMGTGHATLELGWRPTVDHYDDTGTAAAYLNIGEDAVGIWFAGVLAPGLPQAQRLALQRTGSVSGDWRGIGGNLELVAALAVNVPGFPIPRVASRVASLAAGAGKRQMLTALVASGVLAHDTAPMQTMTVRDMAREVVAFQKRQARHDAAARRIRKARQLALSGRLTRKA